MIIGVMKRVNEKSKSALKNPPGLVTCPCPAPSPDGPIPGYGEPAAGGVWPGWGLGFRGGVLTSIGPFLRV